MPRRFHVKVKLEEVRRNLSAVDAADYSLEYVRGWLVDAGFQPRDDGWVVIEADLGHLQPSEVEEIQLLDEPSV